MLAGMLALVFVHHGEGFLGDAAHLPDVAGILHVENFSQTATGVLAMEIAGRDNSDPMNPQYDEVDVGQTANLGGMLAVSLSFPALASDAFTILTAPSVMGEFSNAANGQRILTSDGGASFLVTYLSNAVRLSNFVLIPAGDFNADGIVDAADYVIWRKNVGTNNPDADGNRDGTVNAADYNLWHANIGHTLPGTAAGAASGAAIPEPSVMILFGIAPVLWWSTSRRKLPGAESNRSARCRAPKSSSASRRRGSRTRR